MAKDRVGIIGPGRMGLAMLKHLKKHGFDVTVYDIDEEQLARAVEAGGIKATSAKEVGDNSDFIIVGVGFEPEVYSCLTESGGALEGMEAGGIIAVCSTASVSGVKELALICEEKGIAFLDAPIARGRWAADEGTLLALVGGSDGNVERLRPVFNAFCSDIKHMGDIGHGQVAKTMNNYLLWVNGCALIEAGQLAEATGIDLPKLRNALMMSSGDSAALRDWDRMTFTWALKDMQMMERLMDGANRSFPLAGLIKELVKDGRAIKANDPPNWSGQGQAKNRI
ncbi:MAG: NAD(P)-dependent oxidoreductase [Pseudomonadota bacterium]|nr:NAD(P)-dependent oxidoreductase [Pseudomonadota bacterium]